ncbi:MAG: helix-turn-helix domain-containing protein [Roseburia sp.]|nr:helix-turn-helix domain-containing protein [Roseburia sp.]MCM1278582.1 helix-turn-helix domain-containing protein [Robinsoniella sp.]
MEQKIKQDNICIGKNIRRLRLEKKMGQTELVSLMQLRDVEITREALVKIERGIQHVKATQLKVIKEILNVSYDEIFKEC